MKSFKLCCILLLAVVTLSAKAQESQFVKADSWQELFAKAKKENKMVFIDSYFVGCHPCKQMEDEVFPLPGVMKQMKDNFISVKIDFMTDDFGKQLQIKYGVTGFPTFLVLNSDGQLVSRFSGYTEADKFQNLLKDALTQSKRGKVLRGFSTSLAVNYPEFYTAYFTNRKAMSPDTLIAYLKQKDITVEANAMPFLVNRAVIPELSDYLLKNYYKLEEMYGKDLVWSKRIAAIAAKMKRRIPQRDDTKFASFLKDVKPLFSNADWPYAKLDIAEEYYYKLYKDHKAFFKYAAANYNDDGNKIRYMAMYLYAPNVDQEERKLFAEWMQLVVKENSGYDVLSAATGLMMKQNEPEKAKQYASWGLKKAQLLKRNEKYFQSILDKTS